MSLPTQTENLVRVYPQNLSAEKNARVWFTEFNRICSIIAGKITEKYTQLGKDEVAFIVRLTDLPTKERILKEDKDNLEMGVHTFLTSIVQAVVKKLFDQNRQIVAKKVANLDEKVESGIRVAIYTTLSNSQDGKTGRYNIFIKKIK